MFPVGDSRFEAADFLTFLTKGIGNLDGLTVTYSEDRRNFDKPTIYARNQARIPVRWQLNDLNEWAKTPDIAEFSRDDTGSNPMSFGGLISISLDSDARVALSKDGDNGTREWELQVLADETLRGALFDDSAALFVGALSDDPLELSVPLFIGFTYDSNASAKAAAGDDVTIYRNGQVLATTAINNASYEGMEALAADVYLGAQARAGVSAEFGNWLSTFWFSHKLVTAADMVNLNDIYVAMQRAQRSPQLAGIF